ncbi:hypothetical protein EYF80_046139 [Liparis tanakae]|uniref:Uncharacterized protein n=1 Tax=Liparis tanakae TaxID=230148 RepID=A0A4Z2FS28_9TELE|nr:hypothetical protein EYF80_046139 [Liparis tanakae]
MVEAVEQRKTRWSRERRMPRVPRILGAGRVGRAEFSDYNRLDQNVTLDEAHVENEKQAWECTPGSTLPSSV